MASIVCNSCDGTGKVACGSCGGDGRLSSEMEALMYINEASGVETGEFFSCPTCSGTGDVACPVCDGTGSVPE